MLIIGITGKARHGKDSIANVLVEQLGRCKIMRLADPLKEFVMKVFGWTCEEMEANKDGLIDGVSPRIAMQTLGTEWGRQLSDDIWVNYLLRRIAVANYVPTTKETKGGKHYMDLTDVVVVPDVRFQNESDALRRIGGVIIRVYRPDVNSVNPHASENDDIQSDYVVANTGSLEDLKSQVINIINQINERHTLEEHSCTTKPQEYLATETKPISSIDLYSQTTRV